jgi:hypothetical protein
LNFQRKTPENIAELDYTVQGMLKGTEGPLPTVLKNMVCFLYKKSRDC